jgi:hypothetical protein
MSSLIERRWASDRLILFCSSAAFSLRFAMASSVFLTSAGM